MVKVGIISTSVVTSRVIGVTLISRGYYANHIFPNDFDGGDSFDVFVMDYDGIKKFGEFSSDALFENLVNTKKYLILVTSEKDVLRLREFHQKGVKGIVDSSLRLEDVAEKVYEILQTLPISDNDKRKHYRVRVEHGVMRVEILPDKFIEGNIYDISAGGVSANFSSEVEANMFINNKAYPCEIIFGNVVIRSKVFLVRRDRLFCGFRFFGLDNKQLMMLSEFIYHSIIEETYGKKILSGKS